MLELREAAWAFRQVVDEQRRPLCADDLRGRGDRAGRRLVNRVHRAHCYPKCSGVSGTNDQTTSSRPVRCVVATATGPIVTLPPRACNGRTVIPIEGRGMPGFRCDGRAAMV